MSKFFLFSTYQMETSEWCSTVTGTKFLPLVIFRVRFNRHTVVQVCWTMRQRTRATKVKNGCLSFTLFPVGKGLKWQGRFLFWCTTWTLLTNHSVRVIDNISWTGMKDVYLHWILLLVHTKLLYYKQNLSHIPINRLF